MRGVPTLRRTGGWVGWAVVPLALVGYAVHLVLGLTSPSVDGQAAFSLDDAMFVLGQLVVALVGALVVSRRRDVPIGWLFCAAGLIGIAEGIAARSAVHALVRLPGSSTSGTAAWLSAAFWYPNKALLVLAGLLFPSGRPPSRRWWSLAWLLAAGGVLVAAAMLVLWPVRGLELLEDRPSGPGAALGSGLMSVAVLLLVAAAVTTVIGLVVRFRRARGVERQQLKWFAYAAILAVIGMLLTILPDAVGVSTAGPFGLVGRALTSAGVVGIPVAAGVAILRYRLYEIDRIIQRTLVYGLLTGLLGVVYATAAVVLGQLVGQDRPRWAVAGATLAVAALFQPARRRIQAVVDRRFNRRRYHAAETIASFSARLRQQIDLDLLTAELLTVAHHTMEPTAVSLWLRRPAASLRGGLSRTGGT
jgi:hypothetical protein